MTTRRELILSGAALAGGALVGAPTRRAEAAGPSTGPDASFESRWAASYSGGRKDVEALAPGLPGQDYQPVVTPNGATLPFRVVDGVKVFHLVIEEVEHEFAPGLTTKCWAFNGSVAALTIEAVERDRVRIYVTNRLAAATSVHWHGIYFANGMDGVSGITQKHIQPGETFRYEWTFRQHGTYMFHSHHDEMTQVGLGLTGMLIVHPRERSPDHRVDRDFSIMLGEFLVEVGTSRPNSVADSSFNVLTFNGRAFPGTEPLVVKTGDRVRIRYGNLSPMDHHPIHLHGYHFRVTATDGAAIPLSAQWPETTVLVAVGQTRDVEFIADEPGDWIFHCHMTHHMMNQMGHRFPNLVGVDTAGFDERVRSLLPDYMTMGQTGMAEHAEHVKMGLAVPPNSIPMKGAEGPFDPVAMGGLLNVLKVRDTLDTYDRDPGWYVHPKGTVATVATRADSAETESTSTLDLVPMGGIIPPMGTKGSKQLESNAHPDHGCEVGRLNRAIGQLEGVKRMIEDRRYCPDILTQLRAVHAAVRAVEANILEHHLEACVRQAFTSSDPKDVEAKIAELTRLYKKTGGSER